MLKMPHHLLQQEQHSVMALGRSGGGGGGGGIRGLDILDRGIKSCAPHPTNNFPFSLITIPNLL